MAIVCGSRAHLEKEAIATVRICSTILIANTCGHSNVVVRSMDF